jgi:pimeloyl-ACP methyl ester carboxylesterase
LSTGKKNLIIRKAVTGVEPGPGKYPSEREAQLESVRKYGRPPFTVAVIHGGPGALGDMEPVAKELSQTLGVLEPLQRATDISGLIEELHNDLNANTKPPVILIGHSWGAWLILLFASAHPEAVKKAVIIGCPPVRQEFADLILKNRLSRLDPAGQIKFAEIIRHTKDPSALRGLLRKTDAYDPVEDEDTDSFPFIRGAYQDIWNEAEGLRRSGELEDRIKKVACPVIAIHGSHDPHPAEGVQIPLSGILKYFKFTLLQKCGHYPWKEKQAREEFFSIIKREAV